MQISINISAVIFATFVASTCGTPTKIQSRNHTVLEEPQYVACGGVLTASSTFISYKPATTISPNERCVWTIRSPDAVGYSLDILTFALEPQPGETGLTASCLRNNSISLSTVDIKASGLVSLNACPILILTFFSGENILNSKGFVIIYESISGGNSGVSQNSLQYVTNGEKGLIRYPSTVCSTYTNFEVSSFVFTPPGNKYNPARKSLVTFTLNSFEGNCFDNIRVFRFSPSSGWTHNESIAGDYICDDTEMESWAVDDMLMLIFRSDSSITSLGFHLTYNSLPFNFD
ncbi:unnamed protein product [Orchesella dallaii]|uniref:CUB domain-containing protein n=1 Tax=Orchesella dallaii TaxID=48710 RepID=A0ABP1RLG1_9HEXA